VFAGARQAGKDLNVNVPELGAQAESDINGEITILENAVAEKPAAVVIAPTQFKALGKPIDEAAKKVPIIGIDSAADSKAFTSFLTTDNEQGGRIAPMAWLMRSRRNTARPKAMSRSSPICPASARWRRATRASRRSWRPNIRA